MSSVVPLNWYGVLLVVSALSAWILTFPARHIAVRIGYVAQPDDRKVHTQVTPQAGGVAMFLAMLVAWAVAASVPALSPLFHGSSEPLGADPGCRRPSSWSGSSTTYGRCRPRPRWPARCWPPPSSYFMGVTWFQFKVPLAGTILLSPEWTPLLTALWVIAITNAVNLIDGLDGLAAGVVAIASAGPGRLRAPSPASGHPAHRQHRTADRRHHLWHLRRLPPPQFPPGPDLHG